MQKEAEILREKEKSHLKEKINSVLDLPGEIILDLPKLTLVGNKNLTIENHKGIIEYTDEIIRINTKKQMLKINGLKLEIKSITEEEIFINGDISAIEFLS